MTQNIVVSSQGDVDFTEEVKRQVVKVVKMIKSVRMSADNALLESELSELMAMVSGEPI